MPAITMRRLIHIPVIHTAADLGSLSEHVRAHYTKICGPTAWGQREHLVRAIWNDIQQNVDGLHLEYPKTRIYQDGLPICGFEERIVRELAQAGSSNHQLILRLMERGATLMGTEDPGLLVQEYELQKRRLAQAAAGETAGEPAAGEEHPDEILQARDAFISKRIADTLLADETGLLFLGALHQLDGLGSTDVRIDLLGADSHEAVRRPRP
jgi:hypothetical protein